LKAFESHLNKGEIEEAKKALNSIDKDLEPSVYWFSMGQVYAKDNNWADARIAFLKSHKIFPRQETIDNLEIIEKKLVVSEVEAPRSIKDHLINSTYFIGAELALTLNLALLILGLWNFKKSKNLRHFLMITVVMVMLSGLSLWTRHWPWSVAEQEVDVYHGPSEIFDKVQVVPKGIKFLGLEKDSWIKIIYPSRFEGWVKKENISEL